MARFLKDRSLAQGQVPGSAILIGEQKMTNTEIDIFDYDKDTLVEKKDVDIEDCKALIAKPSVTWINIYGIHDMELMQKVSEIFNISNLMLEDILNTDNMPKFIEGTGNNALILKMLHYNDSKRNINAEQITVIMGGNYVLTIQEKRGDVFAPLRERIRNSKGRIRKKNNDYLSYALLDIIADNYLILVEKIGRKIEELEDHIFNSSSTRVAQEIYHFKTELTFLRKSIRPVKEIIILLRKDEYAFVKKENDKYMSSLLDLIHQVTESIELYNNLVSDQLNTYNTITGNRMNQIMKILTMFASVFIPLTFMAGIYGMNFEYLPELSFKYGYLVFWIITLVTVGSFIYYFKKKDWL